MVELFIPRGSTICPSVYGNPMLAVPVITWLLETFGQETQDGLFLYDEFDWSVSNSWMSSASLGDGEFCRLRFGSTSSAVMFKMRWL
jgi:hypothetical protein